MEISPERVYGAKVASVLGPTIRSRFALGGMGSFLFGAASMFATMYSTQAILPELGREFGVSAAASGLSISVLIVSLACGAWLWGPASDRIGRRRSLVLASALLIVPTALLALAPTFEALLVVRAAQGLCMPGLLTVGVPYIAEVFVPRLGTRAMGLYLAALVVGGLVGRLGVALVTAELGWRAGVGMLTLMPLAATIVMRRSLPPDAAVPSKHRIDRATLAGLLRNRTLVGATLAGSGLFFGFVAAFSYVDYRLQGPPFSLSPTAASLIFVLWLAGGIGPSAGRIAGSVGWRRVATTALGLSAVGLGLTLVPALPALVAGLALFAVANFAGVTSTQLGVAESSRTDRGAASAVYYSTYYLAGALGAYAPGLAWRVFGWDGVVGLALCGFAIGLAGVVATAATARRFSLARAES